MTKDVKRCKNCRFWSQEGQDEPSDHGDCKRHAPQCYTVTEVLREEASEWTVWPSTHKNDWCGEWQCRHEWANHGREGAPCWECSICKKVTSYWPS